MSAENESPLWLSLPTIVTDVIFNYLSAKDLGSLSRVSKSARVSVDEFLRHKFSTSKTLEKSKALQEFLAANADLLLPIELKAREQMEFLSGTSFGLFCVQEMVPKDFFKRLPIVSTTRREISIRGRHDILQDPSVGRTTLALRNEGRDFFSITRDLGKNPGGVYGLMIRIHLKVVQPTSDFETISFSALGVWNSGHIQRFKKS